MANKIKCNCCENYTIEGLFDICPVCFWQKDDYQERHIEDDAGPNYLSLNRAIINYKTCGAIEKQFEKSVRPPRLDELQPKN